MLADGDPLNILTRQKVNGLRMEHVAGENDFKGESYHWKIIFHCPFLLFHRKSMLIFPSISELYSS